MTAVGVDVESIEHLDFATPCTMRMQTLVLFFGIPIQSGPREEPCPNPAVGVLRCQGCGRVKVACERHRDYVLTHPSIACVCGRQGPGLMVYAFELLRVNS